MSPLRTVLTSAVVGLLWPLVLHAQPLPTSDEAAVREAFSRFQDSLIRRDVVAVRALLTADVVWVFPDSISKNSGDEVASYLSSLLTTFDMNVELVRLKMVGHGTATLVLRGQNLLLPKRDGKYTMVFNRDPMLSRWRLADGKWRLYYVLSDVPKAAALVQAEGLE